MALSEAKKKSNKKWNDENMNKLYDHIHLIVPKGKKDKIKAFAESRGESVNGFINRVVDEAMGEE